jgi:ribosomal-protein-alanine N-acetyltransferase
MRIELANCVLRPWRVGDEASLAEHANDRDVWRNLRDHFPHPYARADAEAWVAFASKQAQPTSFAIEVDAEAGGGIGLTLHDDVERVSAEIGYWL